MEQDRLAEILPMLQQTEEAAIRGPTMRRGMIERLAQIETQARILARSGRYRGASSIEIALLAEGFTEARKVFANRWSRCELDRLCEVARRHHPARPEAA